MTDHPGSKTSTKTSVLVARFAGANRRLGRDWWPGVQCGRDLVRPHAKGVVLVRCHAPR